jgi:hypothetical protein
MDGNIVSEPILSNTSELLPPIWESSWVDAIQNHIYPYFEQQERHHRQNLQSQELEPVNTQKKYLVLNAGLWANNLNDGDLLLAIQQTCQQYNITSIYKTTTARNGQDNVEEHREREEVACSIFDHCLNLNWTSSLSGPEHYWDNLHFQAHVYQRFNEDLLEMIKTIY